MATLVIHDVPDELYRRLEERARAAGRSLDAEVLLVLERNLSHDVQRATNGQAVADDTEDESQLSVAEILKRLRERQKFNPAEHGLPDSTTLLREDRDR